MAWGVATDAIVNTNAYNGDKPCVLGVNALESRNAAGTWHLVTEDGGGVSKGFADCSTASIIDATYPTSYAHDRYKHLKTRPTDQGAGTSGYGLFFDLKEDTTIGSVVILGHNFHQLAATIEVRVYIADQNTFGLGLAYNTAPSRRLQIARWSGPTSAPLCAFDLGCGGEGLSHDIGDHKVYTSVRYLQISIFNINVPASDIIVPQIGEAFIGPHRPISRQPNVPWDDYHLGSDAVDFLSRSGIRTRYTRSKGQRIFTPTWNPTGGDTYGLDDVATLKTFYETDTAYGTRPFLFTPKPKTEVDKTYLCQLDASELELPIFGPYERRLTTKFVEMAPYRSQD